MNEQDLELLKQDIDEKVGIWLTANGISEDVQQDLDYSDYDNELEDLLRRGQEMMDA